MTRQEKETMGINEARKDYTDTEISKIIEEYKITSADFVYGRTGQWARPSRINFYNANAEKYRNRPVYKIEMWIRIDHDAYIKEVFRLFSEKLK